MKTLVGFALGIMFILCLAAAAPRYFPQQPQPNIYTLPADPNDQIYNGLSLNAEYIRRFGNYERTIVFYNIALNSARFKILEEKINGLLAPPAIEPNEPNEPNTRKEQ